MTKQESLLHEKSKYLGRKNKSCEKETFLHIVDVLLSTLLVSLDVSIHEYCVKYMELSDATTSNFVCVAKKSREIPEIAKAITQGQLRIGTARKVMPVITKANATTWLTKAATLKQRELEREVANEKPQAKKPDSCKDIGRGWMRLNANITIATNDKLQRAKEVLGTVELDKVLSAALEDLLNKRDPLRKAARAKKKSVSDRSICVTIGRAPIPAQVLHEVNERDQCTCQNCGTRYFMQHHHRTKVAEGGQNTPENIITLCGPCHRRLHQRESLQLT